MRTPLPLSGFIEVSHTADLALDIFGTSLEDLFLQAAKGMLSLLEIDFLKHSLELTMISIKEEDIESLLVAFLEELLFIVENHHYPVIIDIKINDYKLESSVKMASINTIKKEIKAITFNGLKIIQEAKCYRTHLVFDV